MISSYSLAVHGVMVADISLIYMWNIMVAMVTATGTTVTVIITTVMIMFTLMLLCVTIVLEPDVECKSEEGCGQRVCVCVVRGCGFHSFYLNFTIIYKVLISQVFELKNAKFYTHLLFL